MANPTLQFAALDLSLATIYSTSSNQTSFIRVRGDFTNSSNTITNVVDVDGYLGLSSVEINSMGARSSGETDGYVQITGVNIPSAQITLSSPAVATNQDQLIFIAPQKGYYYIKDVIFSKIGASPDNPPENFTYITGSDDANYDSSELPWAVVAQLAATSSIGVALTGQYGQYFLSKVPQRDSISQIDVILSSSTTPFAFSEPSSYGLTTNQPKLLIAQLSGSFTPLVAANDAGISQGLGLAPYNTVVASTLASLASGSEAGFPYTGSAEITGSLGVTGSSEFLINSSENFIIKNASSPTQSLFNINQDGVAVFRAREGVDGVPTAIVGGLYFTTSSAYIGVN
jgi:hypothetical protein